MPYDVAGDDLLASLKQQCALVNHRLRILESSRMYNFALFCCFALYKFWYSIRLLLIYLIIIKY